MADGRYQHLRLGPLRALKSGDLLHLGKINILCGKNNTGKSTLLEAATNQDTLSLGLSPDETFIEGIIATNRQAMITQAYSSPATNLNRLRELEPIFREAACSREAWFSSEQDQLTKLINEVAQKRDSSLIHLIHTSGIANGLRSRYEVGIWRAIYVPPTRSLQATGGIATRVQTESNGTGVVNGLFHLQNQAPRSSDREISDHLQKAFAEITDGFAFTIRTESGSADKH